MKKLPILFTLVLLIMQESYAQDQSETYQGKTIDVHEVTIRSFEQFVESTGYISSAEKAGESFALVGAGFKLVPGIYWRHDINGELIPKVKYDSLPVTNVSYEDAKAYCQWKKKSLPTETEWRNFASAGKDFSYSGSNRLSEVGWFDRNSGDRIHKIMQLKPNSLGVYDMTGNVFELTINQKGEVWALGGGFFSDRSTMKLKDQGYPRESTKSFPTMGFRCICEK